MAEPLLSTRADAHRARQHLTVGGLSCQRAMDAQIQSMNNIRHLVYSSLRYEEERAIFNGRLTFQNVVFTKVSCIRPIFLSYSANYMVKVNHAAPEKCVMLESDDPTGKAAQIKDTWIVTRKVKTGQRTDDGRLVPMCGLLIRPGDFVDVTATVDIVTTHSANGRQLRVFLAMQSVIRLKKGKAAITVSERYQGDKTHRY